MTEPKRITVASNVYAAHVYPELASPKSANAVMVNIVLSDDEALNLARHLIQAARVTKQLTIAARRKPSVKNDTHLVTVTYEPRMRK
jgi:hypothetical protein